MLYVFCTNYPICFLRVRTPSKRFSEPEIDPSALIRVPAETIEMEENLAVATLNVYCPKSVIARNEELQRVFESTNYCVRVTPLLQSPKNYVLRFERLENRYYVHPIQEESEEQRNYNEDYNTLGITAIPK